MRPRGRGPQGRRPARSPKGVAAAMHEAAERLAESLLYEGYALYPYTPGATKNATPTPFGIVYPPAYASAQPVAFDHLQVECIAVAADDAEVEAAAVFLQAAGQRHEAGERRDELAPVRLGSLLAEPSTRSFVHEPGPDGGMTASRPGLSGAAQRDGDPLRRACGRAGWRGSGCCSDNATPLTGGGGRRDGPASGAATLLLSTPHDARAGARAGSSRRSSARASPAPRSQAARASTPGRCSRRRPTTRCSAAPIMLPEHPQRRAGEPRQPLRQHRDRGGAAAARPGALRRRARGDRARRTPPCGR